MTPVQWGATAKRDLFNIVDYIAQDDPAAAWRVRDAIKAHMERLTDHNKLGKAGRVKGTRELVIPGLPYIAVYRLESPGVLILRVLHGAQMWPPEGG